MLDIRLAVALGRERSLNVFLGNMGRTIGHKLKWDRTGN